MKLTIHRGAKEIGGTCIELKSGKSRILIDFGLPLVDEEGEPFDSKSIIGKTNTELIQNRVLPNLQGLYKDEVPTFDGVLLSHPHQDHYGLLSYIHPGIPIYLTKGCKKLLEISYYFGQTQCHLQNVVIIMPWEPFSIGEFQITSYLVDHSGFDAIAFLIECESKRIFYSGDFRGHGRKSVLFDNIVKEPPQNIDYLILEGTMINREKGDYETENDVEKELVNLFNNNESLFFLACSSQNIDRIVSVFRACINSKRIFVIDPYTAYILDKLKDISSNIPQSSWENNIKIYFVPNSYTKKMGEDKTLYRFKSAKITYEEIHANRTKMVIKDCYKTRNIFANKKDLVNSVLIYSMWSGYLPQVKEFWDDNKVPIKMVHTGGHAYVEELQKFVKAIQPQYIIPNHTFYPNEYSNLFGDSIKMIPDGETVEI